MKLKEAIVLVIAFFVSGYNLEAQIAIPIYSDYLSDNIYLVHTAAAGLSKTGKIRLTHRQQWASEKESPSLKTFSISDRIGDRIAYGGIVFNDRNGYYSQLGIQGSFVYRIQFKSYHHSYGITEDRNLLSFGLSGTYFQHKLDEQHFLIPDPLIGGGIESNGYFNTDFGVAYHFRNAYLYSTVKNLMVNKQPTNDEINRNIDSRRYLFSFGGFIGKGNNIQFEPSMMLQYVNFTQDMLLDINAKLFKTYGRDKRGWIAISLRNSIGKEFKGIRQITPIAGLEFGKYLVSYTYSYIYGEDAFRKGSFHQITLGMLMFRANKHRRFRNSKNPYSFKIDN